MRSRRQFLRAAAVSAAALTANACSTLGDSQGGKPKTFVLVHGAWHGGWCWGRVARLLRAQGHVVYAPSLTGLADRSHLIGKSTDMRTFIQDIANLIESEELGDVILVGHSVGGVPITGVADRIAGRLRHLVYLDALIVQNGQSILDVFGPEATRARIKLAEEYSGGVSFPSPPPEVFAVTDPADQAWLKRRLTPHPLASYLDKLELKHPVGNGVPKTYIVCTKPLFKPQESTRQWLKTQSGWGTMELAAGHDAMVIAPRELADMLLQIT
jgi:pimeloyl-ACP methyl ester carboxylesterase